MNKNMIMFLAVIGIVVMVIVLISRGCSKDETVNPEEEIKEPEAVEFVSVVDKFTDRLENLGLPFEKKTVGNLAFNATEAYEYIFEEGTYLQVFVYDKNSTTFKNAKATGRLTIEGTTFDAEVTVVDNYLIRIKHEGTSIDQIKKMMK